METGSLILSRDASMDKLLDEIASHLKFIEALAAQHHIQLRILIQERNTVKSYHWVTVVLVLFVAYLVGVKYPSIGASALSKIGLA